MWCVCVPLNTHISHCWLQEAKIACSAVMIQDFMKVFSILIKYTVAKAQCILSVDKGVLCLT